MVHVRAVMVNASTGAPRSEATFSKEIFVRPGAVIVLPGTAELRPNHAIRFQVQARCDTPWVPQGLYVAASQFNGRTYASVYLDVPCDGVFHHRTVLLKATGIQFARGWIIIDSFLHTLDPVNFDPAPSTAANRGARVILSPRARPPGPTHGGPMKRVIVGGLCLAAALVGALSASRRVSLPSGRSARSASTTEATEGQFDVFTGSVQLRCKTGLTVSSVHLSFTQAGVTLPEVSATPVPCDGTWRRQSYTASRATTPARAGARTDGARRHRHRSGARRGDVDA